MKKLLIFFILISNAMFSQVYNYLPVTITNIETNPSFVASPNSNFLINTAHINNFQSTNAFSFNTLRISNYFKENFYGIGLSLNNTNISDSIRYNHAAFSLGYRNIIGEAVYVKIGMSFKIIDINAPNGDFAKFRFEPKDSIYNKVLTSNMNIALTFSSSKEMVYATLGRINIGQNWINSEHVYFPTYNYINIGNFISLITREYENRELSLLLINENNIKNKTGYYFTYYNVLRLSRQSIIKYGGDIGYNNYFSIRPCLMYSKRINLLNNKGKSRKYEFMIFKISAELSYNKKLNNREYLPAYCFNIMYNI